MTVHLAADPLALIAVPKLKESCAEALRVIRASTARIVNGGKHTVDCVLTAQVRIGTHEVNGKA